MTEEAKVKKKRNKSEEQKIQTGIKDWCKKVGLFCYKNSTVGIYDPRSSTFIPAPKKGITDLTILLKGKAYWVEVKKPGGVLSDDQVKFIQDVEATGNIAFTVYSVEEFKSYFEPLI